MEIIGPIMQMFSLCLIRNEVEQSKLVVTVVAWLIEFFDVVKLNLFILSVLAVRIFLTNYQPNYVGFNYEPSELDRQR